MLGARGRRGGGDRRRAVAKVEPVAGDRRRVVVAGARAIGAHGERRARQLADAEPRHRWVVGRGDRGVGRDPRHPCAARGSRSGVDAGRAGHAVGGAEMVTAEGERGQPGPAHGPGRSGARLVAHHAKEQLDGLRGRGRAAGAECRAASRCRSAHVPGREAGELVRADQVRSRQGEVHRDRRTAGERAHVRGGKQDRAVQAKPVRSIDVHPIGVPGGVARTEPADQGGAQFERDQQRVSGGDLPARGEGHAGRRQQRGRLCSGDAANVSWAGSHRARADHAEQRDDEGRGAQPASRRRQSLVPRPGHPGCSVHRRHRPLRRARPIEAWIDRHGTFLAGILHPCEGGPLLGTYLKCDSGNSRMHGYLG